MHVGQATEGVNHSSMVGVMMMMRVVVVRGGEGGDGGLSCPIGMS